MVDPVKYLDLVNIITMQRWAVFKKIQEYTKSRTVYPGLKFGKEKTISPEKIPGIVAAGWNPYAVVYVIT